MMGVLESRRMGRKLNWKGFPLVVVESGKVTFKGGTAKYLAVGGGGFGGYYGAGGAGSGFVETGEITLKENETLDVFIGAGGTSKGEDGGDTTIGKTVVAKGGKSSGTVWDGGAGWSGGGASACCDGDPKRVGGKGGWNGGDGGNGRDGRDPGVGGKGQKINLPDLDIIHPGKGGTNNSTADQPVRFYGGGGGGVMVAGHPVGSPKRLHGGQGFGAGGGCCSDYNYIGLPGVVVFY